MAMRNEADHFEVLVRRGGDGSDSNDMVPFEAAPLECGWGMGDGYVRWIVSGVELLDGSFEWYVDNHLSAVCEIVCFSLRRKARRTTIAGSIIQLITEPVDVHHAKIRRVCERMTSPVHPREERQAVMTFRPAARLIIEYLERHYPELDQTIERNLAQFKEREHASESPDRVASTIEWFWRMKQALRAIDQPARHRPRGPRV